MDDRHEGFFWLVLVLASVLTVLYVQRHNLPERYLDYQKGVAQVQDAERQCQAIEAEIATTRARVENLGSDPLEIEESIRHNKDYVRSGETVFRIEKSVGGRGPGTGEPAAPRP